MSASFANKTEMQNLLFAELSKMFGKEVPLYDKSLLVNKACNQAVCALLRQKYRGFEISEAQLEKTSGERHGAIRIGKPEEYRWIAKYFAAFGLLPHNFYDMTNLGGKSQPVIATAFRSPLHPEHRVFTSLLMTDYFDPDTKRRIEALLAPREVFSARAKELTLKSEREGGLTWDDANALIREGTTRIFKWTGKARDHRLYQELSKAGFKIAADIACFEAHHLNHLTPNTFCMDLYTTAMKFCLAELSAEVFAERARHVLEFLWGFADPDYLKLHFRHLSAEEIARYSIQTIPESKVTALVQALLLRLQQPELALNKLKHSGFKDFTEGPPADTPVLLRQDSYKALTEPVRFQEADGSVIDTTHTARFGEIEQRFYATTPKGRARYDECLAQAEKLRGADPDLIKRDYAAYQQVYASCFASFPKTLGGLLEQGLVYGRYTATAKGVEAGRRQAIHSTDLGELVRHGYLQVEGLRYEDFLPFSAAGIFASNLGQYGTKSTAADKPVYTQRTLEEIMERSIIDPNVTYAGLHAESLLQAYGALGKLNDIPVEERNQWEQAVAAYRVTVGN
ncbi:MAG TPA: DUF1338 family protein [Verrucomicrobiae bacterium]|nr:DUF1338 family protein [Verrucomicrobiae bacterium]